MYAIPEAIMHAFEKTIYQMARSLLIVASSACPRGLIAL